MRIQVSNLPLHNGKAPYWLIRRMIPLAESIFKIMVMEFGTKEVIKRLADPYWFQSLSCVLGYDWHSSGTTTVTTGVLKQVLTRDLGLCLCGGKGKRARATPDEIISIGDDFGISSSHIDNIIRASCLTAKVDNVAIQDSFNIYHHTIVIEEGGEWCVIQQGMNPELRMARRYQWLSTYVKDGYLNDSHTGIASDIKVENTLNMASRRSKDARDTIIDLVNDSPQKVRNDYLVVLSTVLHARGQYIIDDFDPQASHHNVRIERVLDMPWRLNWQTIRKIYDFRPRDYEELLLIDGVGPKTVRALALVAEIIYGDEISWRDPVKYTFTVGGKDGIPYPVDKKTMDQTIEVLRMAIEQANIRKYDKLHAIERLRSVIPPEIRESKPLF